MLESSGYDSFCALENLEKDDFAELESFVRKQKPSEYVPAGANSCDYYHKYVGKESQFEILPGHKKCLLMAVKLITEKGVDILTKRILQINPETRENGCIDTAIDNLKRKTVT